MSLKSPTLVNQSSVRMPRAFLKSWTQKLARELKRWKLDVDGDLTIVFLNVAEAKKLNKQYRKRNYATDVLSFLDHDGLGDLVICPQVVAMQAKEHKLTFNEELGYMVLHGVLHLLGFDHEKTEREARLMYKIQDSIFEKIR